MKKIGIVRCMIVGALMSAYAAGAAAQAVNEIEPNYPVAQSLTLGADGKMVVNGVIGVMFGAAVNDQDLYSFYAREGDVLDIDIDNGWKFGTPGRSVDTVLTLFGPGPTYMVERMSTLGAVDEGSVSIFDPYIARFRASASGTYIVGVTGSPQYLLDGGGWSGFPTQNGDYTLIISGASAEAAAPLVQQINIEIKPGSREFAAINPNFLKSKGNIPVALLSSDEFDALKVDRDSLTFGAKGDETSRKNCAPDGRDVNGDGRLDLVCHFENQLAGFGENDLEGVLKGTVDGNPFEGRSVLKVIPATKAAKKKK